MPTARATLAAEHRDVTGKKVATLRRAGRLPAVVYGHGVDSDSVSIDAHEFEQLRRHVGPNALVDLSVDGKKAQPVLVSAVQVHPVNRHTAPRRPVPRPDDRGADGRRPARRHRRVARGRQPGRHAAPPDRVGPDPGPAGPPPAVDRVLGRLARRLRHDHPRPRSRDPRGRDAPDRRRRDHRQGPGAARRGGRRGPGRDRRGRARGGRGRRVVRGEPARPAAITASRPRADPAPRSTAPQRERRPEANTIGKRIVSCSGVQRREPLAERAQEPGADLVVQVADQGSPRRTRP